MGLVRVRVTNSFTLNGTIDGHDPIGATFRIDTPDGHFWLTVISVNWGRGYTAREFVRNVRKVLRKVRRKKHVALLIQELDEADLSAEHKEVRKRVPFGSTFVEWWTREPIVVYPGDPVRRQKKVMTMDQGSEIGAPHGTGPRRFFVTCIVEIKGVKIGLGNTHPHRNLPDASVQRARSRGELVMRREINKLTEQCDVVIWGGDMNDLNFPSMHVKEKVAKERGLDTLRYIVV